MNNNRVTLEKEIFTERIKYLSRHADREVDSQSVDELKKIFCFDEYYNLSIYALDEDEESYSLYYRYTTEVYHCNKKTRYTEDSMKAFEEQLEIVDFLYIRVLIEDLIKDFEKEQRKDTELSNKIGSLEFI